jgi:hypothetical protein
MRPPDIGWTAPKGGPCDGLPSAPRADDGVARREGLIAYTGRHRVSAHPSRRGGEQRIWVRLP